MFSMVVYFIKSIRYVLFGSILYKVYKICSLTSVMLTQESRLEPNNGHQGYNIQTYIYIYIDLVRNTNVSNAEVPRLLTYTTARCLPVLSLKSWYKLKHPALPVEF